MSSIEGQDLSDDETDPWSAWVAPEVKFSPLKRNRGTELEFHLSVESGNPNYGLVAIAIGAWANRTCFPDQPPNWAIAVCRELDDVAKLATRRIVGPSDGPPKKLSAGDGILLERVADLIVNSSMRKAAGLPAKVSDRKAIRFVLNLNSEDDNADVQRLQRLWRHDKGYRLNRAALRLLAVLNQTKPT